MDEGTARFYSTHAHETALRYEGVSDLEPALRWLAWKPGARLLDVGCGTGRDLALLARLGCDVWGVEPNAEFRAELAALHPELKERVGAGVLPDLGAPFGGGFDSVLCSAVLMHLPASSLVQAISSIRTLLTTGGRLQISVVNVSSGLDAQHRYSDGRLFTPIPIQDLIGSAVSTGFSLISVRPSDDPWSRSDALWTTVRLVSI